MTVADPLAGKIAVVTGASRGLGRALALSLAEAGAQIALLARPSPDLAAVEVEIGRERCLAVSCDVADPASVNLAISEAVAQFGGIDILINNAAIYSLGTIETISDADIRDQIVIDLMGPIYCARAAIPHLRARGGGDIVNLSSESVRMPYPYLGVYAAAKAGVEAFSHALQAEVRDDRIKVSVFRAGRMTHADGQRAWDPAMQAAFFVAIEKSGHAAFGGHAAADAGSMASAILATLRLPRDVHVDLVEVRAF
jgi:NAD(P)-dependent dehydrogenase (short-subunit alcohol dehydrogenase family)